MNREAEKHLDKAEKLFAKGDSYYAQAADEIVAAQGADSTLTNGEVGKRLGKSDTWVGRVLAWAETPIDDRGPGPFSEAAGKPNRDISGAKKTLREAPMEQIEQIISTLPKERQQKIAAAADPSGYAAARVAENERVQNQTPAQRREIEAAKEAIGQPVRQAVASFTTLGVVGHLEQAKDDLAEMISEQTVTAESIYRITEAHDRFVTELEVARAMAGLEERSEA